MLGGTLFELAIILVLIIANGFFAAAEIAVVSARKGRLEQQAALGNRGARVALDLADNPNHFLSTVQVGITLIIAKSIIIELAFQANRPCGGRSNGSINLLGAVVP
jgi:CBS domain containing-hemolysin-like protein